MFGLTYKNDGAADAFATIMGDTAFGAVGLTEKSAKEAGIEYVKGEFTTTDKHPGTLPDTKESHLKLLFTKSGETIVGEVIRMPFKNGYFYKMLFYIKLKGHINTESEEENGD